MSLENEKSQRLTKAPSESSESEYEVPCEEVRRKPKSCEELEKVPLVQEMKRISSFPGMESPGDNGRINLPPYIIPVETSLTLPMKKGKKKEKRKHGRKAETEVIDFGSVEDKGKSFSFGDWLLRKREEERAEELGKEKEEKKRFSFPWDKQKQEDEIKSSTQEEDKGEEEQMAGEKSLKKHFSMPCSKEKLERSPSNSPTEKRSKKRLASLWNKDKEEEDSKTSRFSWKKPRNYENKTWNIGNGKQDVETEAETLNNRLFLPWDEEKDSNDDTNPPKVLFKIATNKEEEEEEEKKRNSETEEWEEEEAMRGLQPPVEIFPLGRFPLEKAEENQGGRRQVPSYGFPLPKVPSELLKGKERKMKKVDPNPLKKMFGGRGRLRDGRKAEEDAGGDAGEIEKEKEGGCEEQESVMADAPSDTESADHGSADKSSVSKLTSEKQPKKLMSSLLGSLKKGKNRDKVADNDHTKNPSSFEITIKEQSDEVVAAETARTEREGIVYAELDMARSPGNVMRREDEKTEYAEIIYPGTKITTERAVEELRKSRENLSSSRENLTEVDEAFATMTPEGKKEAAV